VTAQNLIGTERAKLGCAGATPADDRTIDAMIGACSDAIVKWCRRDFTVRSYDEVYSGDGDRRLLLRSYPILSVESVRYRPVTVLKVINSDQHTNQQARVTVTATGLTLLRVASGVQVLDTTVTWAANPTLNAVASAVTALGNGWSAQVVGDAGMQGGQQGDYGLWPSVDLYLPPSYGGGLTSQGALSCRGAFGELKMHTYELQGYQWDPRGWLLRAIPYTDPELLHPEDLIWPVGVNNFRIQYTAGYPVVPEAVQEACAEWVAELWQLAQRDPALRTQTTAPPGGTAQARTWNDATRSPEGPPPNVKSLLAPYRRHTITTNQG
jgi:hypothetical protein